MNREKLEKAVQDDFTIMSPGDFNFTSAPIFTKSLTDAETKKSTVKKPGRIYKRQG